MARSGTLILVVGASGAGKDTLIHWARGALPAELPLRYVEREITRARTPADQHVAVSDAEFEQRLAHQQYVLHCVGRSRLLPVHS